MCLILFAYQYHAQYPLIVAANRDEYYQRPTLACHWWPEHPDLLAGKDALAGGTWMGVTRQGRFAAITNVRDNGNKASHNSSRGHLPIKFLTSHSTTDKFHPHLVSTAKGYQGYNLLYGRPDNLWYFSNRNNVPQPVSPGLHGLSNATLDTPWPKVSAGTNRLRTILAEEQPDIDAIFTMLESREIADDNELPDTGVGMEFERVLAPAFIESADYGTRSSQVMLIDHQGLVSLHEQQRAPLRSPLQSFRFRLT